MHCKMIRFCALKLETVERLYSMKTFECLIAHFVFLTSNQNETF